MAIPHWTWPERADGDASTAADLAAATGAFEALSDPTRAAILGALYDADGPLAYTDLAAEADVDDNGRLNYHLRRLDGLVAQSDAGYALSEAGRSVVEAARGVGWENARSPNC